MLTLNTLLASADIDPSGVMVLRHRPMEPAIRKLLPWLIAERPDLFLVYQSIQWKNAERAMTRARFVASFIAQSNSRAVFAGFYAIAGFSPLTAADYLAMPANQELMQLGMTGRTRDAPEGLFFDLRLDQLFQGWVGKLVIDWPPPERSWWRWADRNSFPVHAILEESLFADRMPSWDALVLDWAELQLMPRSWRMALSEWRGIYFIYDTARRAGYVGSAYGADNILGRWMNYANTGSGGNKGLKQSDAKHLRFSILQRTSPDLSPAEVIAIEGTWKERLHTRACGLNEN